VYQTRQQGPSLPGGGGAIRSGGQSDFNLGLRGCVGFERQSRGVGQFPHREHGLLPGYQRRQSELCVTLEKSEKQVPWCEIRDQRSDPLWVGADQREEDGNQILRMGSAGYGLCLRKHSQHSYPHRAKVTAQRSGQGPPRSEPAFREGHAQPGFATSGRSRVGHLAPGRTSPRLSNCLLGSNEDIRIA
jgi:hypothetical protein